MWRPKDSQVAFYASNQWCDVQEEQCALVGAQDLSDPVEARGDHMLHQSVL